MRLVTRDGYAGPLGASASVCPMSMSLPARMQEQIVRALPGLEDAEMIRPGYAVEYDFIQPTELTRRLETKRIGGLFLAGQVNGTSGYEEAAAQGDVVIVAHAASFALADRDDVLRTFVTASPAVRADRLGKRQGLSEKDAAKAVKDSDSGRADYLRRFYEIDHESPIHYDLVVSTDALGVDQAAEIVVRAAQG